jgi:DMSO/TMAO reductase YedYZ heme-binding membrane subunit
LNEAIHQLGLWTIRLIFLALAVTPLRHILQWSRLLVVRRMIGVAAFAYAIGHLGLYAADQAFDLAKIATEIALRIYLTIGFAAVLGLAALAATSTDGMIRRLGARNWQRLHRIVYAIALLAVVHYCMQSKLDLLEPMVMAGLYGWLMFYRVLGRPVGARSRLSLVGVAVLGIAVALLFFRDAGVWSRRWWSLAAYFAAVTASHGLLDALTDGGLGVAFFAPFDSGRYFFPWRPIEVSPIGAGFFSARGLAVLASEFVWVWLPSLLLAAVAWGARKLLINRRDARQGKVINS